MFKCIKSDHQPFEEHLFPEALLSLFPSGGMIFTIPKTSQISSFEEHLLSLNYHGIKLQSIDHQTKHLNIILLRHFIGWYRVVTDIYIILCFCYKDHWFTSYQDFILLFDHINISICDFFFHNSYFCLTILRKKLEMWAIYSELWDTTLQLPFFYLTYFVENKR